MRQHFSHHSTQQMPNISGPDGLDLKALDQLTKDRLDAIAHRTPIATALGMLITTGFLKRHQHLQPLLAQLLVQLRLPVITISKAMTTDLSDQILQDDQVTLISRCNHQAGNGAWPAHAHVKAEAIEGLFDRVVFAKRSKSAKTFGALSSSKIANRNRETINDGQARVTAGLTNEALPKTCFHLPEIGSLMDEGGAMDGSQIGKEVQEVAAEVVKDRFILVQTKIFTEQFKGQNFAIGKPRLRSALAQSLTFEKRGQGVVNQAEDRYNQRIQVQGKCPPIGNFAISIEKTFPWDFNLN